MKQYLSKWPGTEFDWNNFFKKYPLIVFLIDLKVVCIFLFSAFDFLHLLEKGILANKDDFSFGLFRIGEDSFMNCNWSDLLLFLY